MLAHDEEGQEGAEFAGEGGGSDDAVEFHAGVLAGGGGLPVLVSGPWVRRGSVQPVTRLGETVDAIGSGKLQRRVDETAALGELSALGANVNSIVDRLRQLEQERETEFLLTRAAIEHLLDEGGRPGALLDTSGRLIASNGDLRAALREGEIESASSLGRSERAEVPELEVDEVRDAGVVYGFVSRFR